MLEHSPLTSDREKLLILVSEVCQCLFSLLYSIWRLRLASGSGLHSWGIHYRPPSPPTSLTHAANLITTITDLQYPVPRCAGESPSSEHKTEMADTAPARVNEGSDELEQASDLDSEDGDAVIARGWPRDHHNLAKKGFRPIWTTRDGYPEKEIPADIREWLDENEERSKSSAIPLL